MPLFLFRLFHVRNFPSFYKSFELSQISWFSVVGFCFLFLPFLIFFRFNYILLNTRRKVSIHYYFYYVFNVIDHSKFKNKNFTVVEIWILFAYLSRVVKFLYHMISFLYRVKFIEDPYSFTFPLIFYICWHKSWDSLINFQSEWSKRIIKSIENY